MEQHIPYAGASAGAQLASTKALIDGWRLNDVGEQIVIAPDELSEGIDDLEIRAGIGLISQTIEVHATSQGALSRLIHTTEQQFVPGGSEDTQLMMTHF